MAFRRLETQLPDLVLIEPDVYGDDRGFLVETFREQALAELGIDARFVQDNHSRSSGPVLRGIHLQEGQAKLVRCLRGRIWDVAVDLRPGSPSYRRWEGFELDDEHHRQLFIPDGFGHGFCLLSEVADVTYRLSDYYDPARERGVAWNDPEIGIEWPISDPLLSERDRQSPALSP